MDSTISDSIAFALTRWALIVHGGLVLTLLTVNLVLWLRSRREVILTWVLAWSANLLALGALACDFCLVPDPAWQILHGTGKLVFALLLIRGIMMFKRDRLAMFHLSRNWSMAAGLAFCLILAGRPWVEYQGITFLVLGSVLAFGALLSGLRQDYADGWFLIAATIFAGVIFLHHGVRLFQNSSDPRTGLFLSTLWFIDIFGEFLIGLCCLLALGQRALDEMTRANENLESTQRALRSLVDADPLTGLSNRRRLRPFLDSARETGGSLIFLDINDFKGINDRWGHISGDRCLCRIADALRTIFRAQDGLFRIGGDEFLVVVPNLTPNALGDRILQLRKALAPSGHNVIPITVAVGTVELRTDLPVDEALALADTAMYSDKAKRRG